MHIRDVADCFVFSIENRDKMVGRAFNFGLDSINFSKEQLAKKIQGIIPKFYVHYSEIGSDPDKRNYIVSSERLRKTGFEAHRSLEEGIRELINGYRMMSRTEFSNA